MLSTTIRKSVRPFPKLPPKRGKRNERRHTSKSQATWDATFYRARSFFPHEHQVVWEYVSNGLQYIDPGTQPIVNAFVDVKDKKITVRDNGRGMNKADLVRYFQMHGENLDRKSGKAGRGMFGTGKSAAFGIGDVLRLTTVCGGLRSKVQLERKDIEAAPDGKNIPVREIESEVSHRRPERYARRNRRVFISADGYRSHYRHIGETYFPLAKRDRLCQSPRMQGCGTGLIPKSDGFLRTAHRSNKRSATWSSSLE